MRFANQSVGSRAKPESDLENLIMCRMRRSIGTHRLVESGDKILVAVSGGKKSLVLLTIMELLRRRSKFQFFLFPAFVDSDLSPGVLESVKESYGQLGFDLEIEKMNLAADSFGQPRSRLALCRICCRRKYQKLREIALRLNCNKVALGHHLDDWIETLLMNLFFSGQIKPLAVKAQWNDGGLWLVRPLVDVEETVVTAYIQERKFQLAKRDCPCGMSSKNIKRVKVANILKDIEKVYPRVRRSLFAAIKNIRPTHLLDSKLISDSEDPFSLL